MKKIKKISTSLLMILLFALISHPLLAEDDDYNDYQKNDDYEENNYKENDDDRPEVISTVEETLAPTTPPPVSTIDIPAATGLLPKINMTTDLIDSDQDGVIDILDAHSGEDDFAFMAQDTNKNGLIDDLEYLMNK